MKRHPWIPSIRAISLVFVFLLTSCNNVPKVTPTSTTLPTRAFPPTDTSAPASTITLTSTSQPTFTPLPSATTGPTATATLPAPEPTLPPLPLARQTCEDAPPSSLQVGLYLYAGSSGGSQVRPQPSSEGVATGQLDYGKAAIILDGPRCAEGLVWWQVQALEGDLTGWAAEGNTKEQWLVPIPYKPAASLPLPGAWKACPGATFPLSRLQVDLYAYVNTDRPQPNLLREKPNIESGIFDKLQPGSAMRILDGPRCQNDKVWWRVESFQGTSGWTAEGDTSSYWLVPIPFKPGIQPGTVSCQAVSEIPVSECQALVSLYASTNGANWNNHYGWLASNTPCAWFGVSCSTQHVSVLALADNRLNGTLPEGLSLLTSLQELHLDGNSLSGPIPLSYKNLKQLKTFSFNNTQLCEPDDSALQTWLNGIPDLKRTNTSCTAEAVPTEDLRPDNGAALVDETIPDGTVLKPGEVFKKTWILKNVGKNTWTKDYGVVFITGTRMNAPDFGGLPAVIKPGQNLTFFYILTAPYEPGTYTAYFMLQTDQGIKFGVGPKWADVFYVQIVVSNQ